MTPRDNNQSPDKYRAPLTPDGTVEFAPDASGEERVDLHLSELTRTALEHAAPSEAASEEKVDGRRGEYGETVLGLIDPLTAEKQVDPTSPEVLRAYTKLIPELRRLELELSDSSK